MWNLRNKTEDQRGREGKEDGKDAEILDGWAGQLEFHSVDVKHGGCKHWVWSWTT